MSGKLITHRIVQIANDDGEYSFVTKGDNNEVQDDEIVKYNSVVGKVIYTMPKFGSVVKILKNNFFFGFCIVLLIAILLYDIRIKNRKISRKLTRKKYEKKSEFYF